MYAQDRVVITDMDNNELSNIDMIPHIESSYEHSQGSRFGF